MLDFVLNGIVWVFALYGFIEILKTIYYSLIYSKIKTNGIYFIIAVKNQEKQIEGFMRSILFRLLYGKEENVQDVIISDLGSSDGTKEILEKLKKDYDFLNILDWKTCKDLIDNVKEK